MAQTYDEYIASGKYTHDKQVVGTAFKMACEDAKDIPAATANIYHDLVKDTKDKLAQYGDKITETSHFYHAAFDEGKQAVGEAVADHVIAPTVEGYRKAKDAVVEKVDNAKDAFNATVHGIDNGVRNAASDTMHRVADGYRGFADGIDQAATNVKPDAPRKVATVEGVDAGARAAQAAQYLGTSNGGNAMKGDPRYEVQAGE